MRVISGTARGHKLFSIDRPGTRPSADRIKESFFNMMSADLVDAVFLDLFSGTGAIGIEALSRGAAKAVFVEKDKDCVDLIHRNLEKTRLSEKADVLCADCLDAIPRLGKNVSAKNGSPFDVIFMDPPYNKGLVELSLNAVMSYGLLKPDGYIVAEQGSKEPIPRIQGLVAARVKTYTTTTVVFFEQRL